MKHMVQTSEHIRLKKDVQIENYYYSVTLLLAPSYAAWQYHSHNVQQKQAPSSLIVLLSASWAPHSIWKWERVPQFYSIGDVTEYHYMSRGQLSHALSGTLYFSENDAVSHYIFDARV